MTSSNVAVLIIQFSPSIRNGQIFFYYFCMKEPRSLWRHVVMDDARFEYFRRIDPILNLLQVQEANSGFQKDFYVKKYHVTVMLCHSTYGSEIIFGDWGCGWGGIGWTYHTCNSGNTMPTTKLDDQLTSVAKLTAAGRLFCENNSATKNHGIEPEIYRNDI